MRKLTFALNSAFYTLSRITFIFLFVATLSQSVWGQCTPQNNSISGTVFEDKENDGLFKDSDIGLSNVKVSAYDSEGNYVGSSISDIDGSYTLENLTDGNAYRLMFESTGDLFSAVLGEDNRSSVQFVESPACEINYGLTREGARCSSNPDLVLTCFVQGSVTENEDFETIIQVEHDFTGTSQVSKIAMHGETGSIWGLVHDPKTDALYSASFVKQYAGLKYTPYTILKTEMSGTKSTTAFADVNALIPQNLPGLTVTDESDCAYGNQVGRVGLGSIILSPDGTKLYTTVLDEGLVVGIDVNDPNTNTTDVFTIPRPSNLDPAEEYRIFALTWHENKIYVGGTVTASVSRNNSVSEAVVTVLDPATGATEVIFRTNYIKGFWQDNKPESINTSHWLTDLDFTDSGEMLLSISDRIGHRFCKEPTNRLDQQYPDLLIVGFDEEKGEWVLEDNGSVNGRAGSGVGNGQGPGGGEFFGFDFWPTNPSYHSETALGSVFVLPGSNEVVAAVYDPLINSYSGGLHRYNTQDGSQTGAIELYTHTTFPTFGKASGFGDITSVCKVGSIEIGNYVWNDTNGNGLQDPGEEGIPNVGLNLYDSNCELIGQTTTDEFGNYAFNDSNVDEDGDGILDGVYPGLTYYVSIDNELYDEVTGLYTLGSEEYTICTANAGSLDEDNIDCDAAYQESFCLTTAFIEVNTNATNHTFDIGLGAPSGFDLALKKEIVGNQFARVGEEMMFMITIYNQGGSSASSVTITDYMPSGYRFDPLQNNGWTLENGVLVSTIEQKLLPGKSISRALRLTVDNVQAANYQNIAEISEALDLSGNPAVDVDSKADDIPDNDKGGIPFSASDDQLNGDGEDDEDDHDPAVPKIFDLATMITLSEDKYYYTDDLVKFDIRVYNQGNVAADFIELTNYFPKQLSLNLAESTGWEMVENNAVFTDENILEAGEVREYCIFFNIEKGEIDTEILNYIEISNSSPVDHPGSIDFDSSPDNTEDNDMGGEVYSSTDNQINDHGVVDEDDHDPVLVRTRYVDLALMKTVEKTGVRAGEDIVFHIDVINQGSAPVQSLDVVDYIPENMTLHDDNWELLPNGHAIRTINLDGTLNKGQKTTFDITLKVDENISPKSFVNYAEITGARGADNLELGSKDIDSTPDEIDNNDNGGVPNSVTDNDINSSRDVDEDDHDPARVSMIEGNLEQTECLENATNSNDGQFEDIFKITAPAGETWYVFTANNYFDISSPDPVDGPLVELVIGESNTMTEMAIDANMSMYTYSVVREDGKEGFISFRNLDTDDIESFTVPAMMYEDIFIEGPQALCAGELSTYCIADPDPTLDYEWAVSGGATFTTSGSCIEIDWGGVSPNASYTVEVTADSGCNVPGAINVNIGTSSGAMSCIGNTNLSLDGDCEVLITPELILTSPILPGQAYSVMLTTESGEVIPNATLTAAHIGMTVSAKVIDGCSGNACWGYILVEDKIKPTIVCEDAFISCNKVDEFGGPFAEDNCGGEVEVIMLNETFTPLQCDDFTAEIVREYQAIDQYGNESDVCQMTVFVERINLDDIVFPDNLIMMDGTALNCDAYDLDMDGVADVEITGVPTYNGEEVFPDFDPLCNTALTFEDDIRFINGVKKIKRTWTAWEWWCSQTTTRKYDQFIEITDVEDPIIECPDDITVSATIGNCEAIVSLPLPTASDECSDDITVQTIPQITSVIEEGDSRIVSFPFSTTPYVVTYRATDAAGNSAECEMTVTVVDDIAPIAICDQNTIVGLNSQGEGYLYAMNLDDGSYDACQLTDMMVRRVDEGGPFSDKVLFTCEDLGAPVMVELRVTDAGGLSNSCMANVIVQDKHAPEVNNLPDVEIECGDSFTPLSQFGEFTFTDACDITIEEDSIIAINSCGTGTITRVITVSDSQGFDVGTQTINIVNSDPFDEQDIISWPLDYDVTISSCDDDDDFHPDNLPAPFAYPVWEDDACDQVAAGFHDDIYPLLNDPNSVCFKIVRHWTIIDWCQMDMNGDPIEFNNVQVIKVTNTKAPDPIVVTPEIDTIVSTDCENGILSFSAMTDDCSPELLNWTIQVDFDQDFNMTGVYDITRTGFGPIAMLNETVPQGTHTIVYSFSNGCGNTETTSRTVSVINNIAPNILCLSRTSIGLGPWNLDDDPEPDTEAACIYVDSLVVDSGTFHPCGTPFELSFSQDSIVKTQCFDCADIGINILTIYAIDIFGNVSSCIDTLEVQDNNDIDICINPKDCISEVVDTTFSIESGCFVFIDNDDLDITQIDFECGDLTIVNDLTGTNTLDGAVLQLGVNLITWTISVESFSVECVQTITVIDEIDPTIDCATDPTITSSDFDTCEYTHTGDAFNPTVDDNCNIGNVFHNYLMAPSLTTLDGATFPIGVTVVTWTVEDEAGNSAQCDISITVEDNEAPSITCATNAEFNDSEDLTTLCTHTVADNSLDAVANDECSPTVTITHDYESAPFNTTLQGATFDLGATVVTFTATDEFGNSATCEVVVTVVDDVDPEITCADPADINESADGLADCLFIVGDDSLDPSVEENCTTFTVEHNYVGAPSSSTLEGAIFFLGETNVTFTVTDAAGNTATCDVTVTVVDDVAPECTPQTDTNVNIGMSQIFIFDESILTQPITDNCDSELTYTFEPMSVDCDDVGQTIVVTITATDDAGNTTTCPINVTVNEPGDFECNPMDITVDLDENGTVSITADDVVDAGSSMCGAMPTVTVEPSSFDCDDIGANIVTINIILGTDTTVCMAMVTVQDLFTPSITCAPDVQIGDSADGDFSCTHTNNTTNFDPIATIDNCDDFVVTHDYDSAPSTTTLNGATFPLGVTVVTWTITDNAGNGQSSTCTFQVTVVDDVDPTCVDQPVIPVTIDVNDQIVLDTSLLPNPYSDNCGIASYAFTPATLDCTDEGITDVTLTVTDNAGNSSDCPVQFDVSVQDTLMCSFNVDVVYLDENGEVVLDAEEIVDVQGGICQGNTVVTLSTNMFQCNDISLSPFDVTIFVNGDSCGTDALMIADTLGPQVFCSPISISCLSFENDFNSSLTQVLNQTEAFDDIVDNCLTTLETTITIDSSALNECNYGVMTRTIVVFDPLSDLSDTCIQEITIEGPADPLTQDELEGILADTVVITECMVGEIVIDTITEMDLLDLVDCGQFEIVMEDLSISEGCPDTILRTYTIDAICQEELLQYTQVIITNDTIAPTISTSLTDTTLVLDPACVQFLDIGSFVSGTDDCVSPDMIEYTYSYGDITGTTDDLAPFEFGSYDVTVTGADGCGNLDTVQFDVEVIDTLDLDFMCVKLVVFIDTVTQMVDVLADLNIEISGNCDNEIEFFVTYDTLNLADTIRTFDCDDVGLFIGVDLFAWEIVNGDTIPFDLVPQDTTTVINICKGEIEVRDPFGACTGTLNGIAGVINTIDGTGIPDYSLTLNGSGLDPVYSEVDGTYAFPMMPDGGSYLVSTYNNNDVMNGISTLDLILIQRHVLGLATFDSPYKYIAADINNNEKISGTDILELRKMLLGMHVEFPNNMSWRAIDAGFEFPDPNDPWITKLPETYEIPFLDGDVKADFVGVKIGDIDGSVSVNLKAEVESATRTENTEILMVHRVENETSVKVSTTRNLEVAGMQFSLDLAGMQVAEIVSDHFTDGEIGFYETAHGIVNVTIARAEAIALDADEIIFEIITECTNCQITPMNFKLSNIGLNPELYLDDELNTVPLAIEWRTIMENESLFTVYQNNPNPWTNFTKVDIALPKAEVVNIKVYDVNGRLISSSSENMNAGMNTIQFDNMKISGSGVFYYEISTASRSERYKMIKLN